MNLIWRKITTRNVKWMEDEPCVMAITWPQIILFCLIQIYYLSNAVVNYKN